jgi:hypothetical protein
MKGHTKGYCRTLSAPPQAVSLQAQKTAVKIDSKNQFSALALIEDLPVKKSQANSWAGRLFTKAPVQVQEPAPVPAPVPVPVQEPATHEEAHEEEETTPYVYIPNQSTSWADME